jgi:hypothetical protein
MLATAASAVKAQSYRFTRSGAQEWGHPTNPSTLAAGKSVLAAYKSVLAAGKSVLAAGKSVLAAGKHENGRHARGTAGLTRKSRRPHAEVAGNEGEVAGTHGESGRYTRTTSQARTPSR